jgi:hypothetical protein
MATHQTGEREYPVEPDTNAPRSTTGPRISLPRHEGESLFERIESLKRENAKLREALTELADCYFKRRSEGLLEAMRRADRLLTGEP